MYKVTQQRSRHHTELTAIVQTKGPDVKLDVTAVRRQMLHLKAQHAQVPNRSQQEVVRQELQTPCVGVALETQTHPFRLDGDAFEEGMDPKGAL